MSLQDSIVQGETLNYSATLDGYPASDGWNLRLVLNPRAGGSVITLNTTAAGADHVLQVTAAVTTTWAVGDYGYQLFAIKGSEVYYQGAGQFKVRAGLIGSTGGLDTRSAAEIGLDNVRAMIRGTATQGIKRYRIGGRELERYDITELLQLESKLANDVKAEQAATAMAAGRPNPRKLQVRMGRA